MPETHDPAIDAQFAAIGSARASEDLEQLVLALALERNHAQHLARVQLERDVLQVMAGPDAASHQPGLRPSRIGSDRARRRDARLGPLGTRLLRPEHERHDPILGAWADVHDAHGLAVPQHGRAVAQGGDLDEPVGDEDDRSTTRALATHDLEHPLGQVGGERRGGLVEDEHIRVGGQGTRQVDDPERGQRQVAHGILEVQVGDAQLRHPAAELGDRRGGQAQVVRHHQVRDERWVLIDRYHTERPGVAG